MKPHSKARTFAVLAILLLPVAIVSQVSITTAGAAGAYSQNFNGTFLGTGAYNLTDNAAANLGWYSLRTTGNAVPNVFAADPGGNVAGQFYNYGSVASADRALGSVARSNGGSTTDDIFYGLRIQNDTGSTVKSVRVQYTGEEWEERSAAAQVLSFGYQISAGNITTLTGAFIPVPTLDLTSPQIGLAGALDGNAAANRVVLNQAIPVTIAPGSEIMLRWQMPAGILSNGLAVDDVTVTLNITTAAPISIGGRVTTSDGTGISRATVTLSGNGSPIYAVTNTFGYYQFTGLMPGLTYVVSVSAKRYLFASPAQVVSAQDDVGAVNFTALLQ